MQSDVMDVRVGGEGGCGVAVGAGEEGQGKWEGWAWGAGDREGVRSTEGREDVGWRTPAIVNFSF